jgi:hypothetical protein
MKFEIDQSGKIEDTSKNTVIAYTNGARATILITRKTKRIIQERFRRYGLTRVYIYLTFAVAIYFLIRNIKQKKEFLIDEEYPGNNKIIINFLRKLLETHKLPSHDIEFKRIGNHPRVHYAAKDVYNGKRKADKIISEKELIKELKMTDGHLRECFSTLVDAQPRSVKLLYHDKGKKSRKAK